MRPHKGLKVWVAQRDNSSKDTKDIFTDLPYGAIQRLNPLQGGARAAPGLLGGTTDSGEDTSRDEKRPHSYSGTLSLYLELPKGPILSSASTVNDTGYQPTAPTVLPLREVPDGNWGTIRVSVPFSKSDLSLTENKSRSFSWGSLRFYKTIYLTLIWEDLQILLSHCCIKKKQCVILAARGMQCTLGGMKLSLRQTGNGITSWTLLIEMVWGKKKRGEWKSWLKAQHSENEDYGIRSHHFMGNRWGNSVRLYFLGLQNHCRWWLQPWN